MDDTGTDNASCGTSGSPCETLEYILAGSNSSHPDGAIDANSTIYVYPGTYSSTSQGLSGTNDEILIGDTTNHAGLTITAQDQQNKPFFQGTNSDLFRIEIGNDVNDVTLSFLKIYCSTTGYSGNTYGPIETNGDNTTIDNCELAYGGAIIKFAKYFRNHTISNNHLHNCW